MVDFSLVFMAKIDSSITGGPTFRAYKHGQKLMVEPKGGALFPNLPWRFSWEDHKKNMGTSMTYTRK